MHIGKIIKDLADKEKLSPEEFSHLLGKKSRHSAYDCWKREDINTRDLRVIAAYFNVSMGSFFEKEDAIRAKQAERFSNDEKAHEENAKTIDENKERIAELKETIALQREMITNLRESLKESENKKASSPSVEGK